MINSVTSSSKPFSATEVIAACKEYVDKLPQAKNEAGKKVFFPAHLLEPQIQEIQSLILQLKAISIKDKHVLAWESSLEKAVRVWNLHKKPLSRSENQTIAATSPPTERALTQVDKELTTQVQELARVYHPGQSQKLFKELSSKPKAHLSDWKDLLTFLIDDHQLQSRSSRVSTPPDSTVSATLRKEFRNSFESSLQPIGIINEGNTCFAAALVQVISMNKVLAGGYYNLLPEGHYAKKMLYAYASAQKSGEALKNIRSMRAAFGDLNNTQQRDAVELNQLIYNDICLPSDTSLRFKDGTVETFGICLEQFIHSNSSWRPFTSSPGTSVNFPMLDLQRQSHTTTLDQLMRYNLNESSLYFAQNPSVFMCNIGRLNQSSLSQQTVEHPLYYEIPEECKKSGLTKESYTLQSFICHYGTTNRGHYIAYHQWKGKFFRADDKQIQEITLQEYLKEAQLAYLSVYSRLTPASQE